MKVLYLLCNTNEVSTKNTHDKIHDTINGLICKIYVKCYMVYG